MAKVKVANKSEVKEDQGKLVNVNGKELALFNIKGEFFAIENICPHRGGPLSEGFLEGNNVNCPWHGWQFDVKTGQNIMPGIGKLNTYKVLVEGEEVFIGS
ncbi:non-heme iron oxygenase ferredoxin subunit [Candidatus Woesearchaeota archaeon]|nr:non-heme iron oxygenase ferredoxin subunit [Candidatus Woesearchaeota archaeon]